MPANVKIIHATDFIRATPDGTAYIEKAEQLLRAVELWHLADKLAHYRRTFGNKTAILCPVEKFDHTRFFALCAENKGFNVQAFTDYEHAMEWLLEGDEPAPRTEIH